jgi:hypothetical protein
MRCFEGRVYDVLRGSLASGARAVGGWWFTSTPSNAPSTVARFVILFGPESHCRGSGSIALRGGGGSRKIAIALLGAHTTSENPPPNSGMQAYIAYLLGR